MKQLRDLAIQAISESSQQYKLNYMLKRRTVWPRSYFEKIQKIKSEVDKSIDYIFIGNMNAGVCSFDSGRRSRSQRVYNNRRWILDFIKERFNENSFLEFSDSYTKLMYANSDRFENIPDDKGFDYTVKPWRSSKTNKHFKKAFVPRENQIPDGEVYFDEDYYKKMCQAKFCLCPGGDSPWSFRFYESLMCGCLPVINSSEEGIRVWTEQKVGYKYYFAREIHEYDLDLVSENLEKFERHNLLCQ